MFCVYVLRSKKNGAKYVGYTNNLKRRLSEHNQGKNFSTMGRGPFELIYAEAYLNSKDAWAREKFLKSGWGKNYLERVLKNYWFQSKKLGGKSSK